MSDVFERVYADSYDLVYQDKHYAAECDLIGRVFKTYAEGTVRTVLDLGCGTGNHAIRLAQRGYKVIGVDRSASMLAHASRKTRELSKAQQVVFHQGDIREVDLKESFDAALMMFAVAGYQVKNGDVLSAFRGVRKHLRPGGLFVFDVWYGPAVLHLRPSERVKVISIPDGQIIRVSTGQLDVSRHVCKVHLHVWRLEGKRLVGEAEESHLMRYFFPLELELLLESAGFSVLRLGSFPAFDQDPDETTWNILAVARAF